MSKYQLVVRATDKGEPSRFSEVIVEINLTDENDHAPIFDPPSYDKDISEASTVGSVVITVTAKDGDDGSNGDVRYVIISGNEKGIFEINEVWCFVFYESL